MPILMYLFLLPFFSAACILILPIISEKRLKYVAIILSLLPLLILFFMQNQLVGSKVELSWLPMLSIEFYLTIDSLSLVFLYLLLIVIPFSLLSVNTEIHSFHKVVYSLILVLEGLLIGFFTARDLAVFTFFWEAMLIPLYFLINIWGLSQRQYAALKFLTYMIAGSALMVAAVLSLYFITDTQGQATFNIDSLEKLVPSSHYAPWLFGVFALAFSVKTPLFPFHAWLPDTYCQSSTPATILLSGILSKAGIYGFIRIGMGIFPSLFHTWSPILLALAIIGVFYGALAASRQNDFKRLLAYSSFSHVNLILVGVFIWNETAHTGAILQAFNHGITITALFLLAGWLEERIHTTSMDKIGGLATYFPSLCWLTLFFVLASVALPGTNNFIGELLIFFGLFIQNPFLTAFLGLIVILSVVYMLRLMQKVYFQNPVGYQGIWTDIRVKEILISLPLIVLTLWIGLYPESILAQIRPATEKTLDLAERKLSK